MQRIVVMMLCLALLVFAGCASQPLPTASPTETEIAQAPSPPPTSPPIETPVPSPTPTSSAEPTPTSAPTPEPSPTPEPVEMIATGNVDVFLSPGGERVGYFVPGTRFTLTGKEEAGFVEVRSGEDVLWVEAGGHYCPPEEVPTPTPTPIPPTPTLVPDRTEFRWAGQYSCEGQILLAPQYQVGSTGQWAGKPTIGARIVAIDVEIGVFTFDIRGERTIQYHLGPTGHFQIEDSLRTGPNCMYAVVAASIYDFQVGDVVWIMGSSQDELQGNVPGVVELFLISGLR